VASHPYNAGDVISGTSVGNAGRIFICITGGTANGTAPTSAFGTAIDGTQVTENVGVTNVPKWQAAYRFSMSITLSSPQPQLAGYLYVIPKAARASWTYWLDGELA
jgi:hypothetical protein